MAQLTPKNFSDFLLRFQENYIYYTSAYIGLYPDLFLDQFVKNQVHVARCMLGNPYAEQLKEFAQELADCCYQIPGSSRRTYLDPEIKQYQFSNN